MRARAHSLQRRMVAAAALFALATALCFSVFCIIFVYVVEDSFFDRMLEQEVAHQRARGVPVAPLRPFVTVHTGSATLPPELARAMAERPRGREFPGANGRHYHLRRFALDDGMPRLLVAEVSAELVVRPQLSSIVGFLAAAAGAIVLLVLGIGYLLARRVSAPLERLTGLLAASTPGQLPQRLAEGFPDNEIGTLARALDQAMTRIAGFIEREQQFTRDASHELRTPLTVIDGAAQLLARHPLPEQAAAQLQRIRAACAHMAQTVDTLLALAREELEQAAPAPVALLPLVERIVVDHAHLLEGKAVQVEVDIDPACEVVTHAALLAILVRNLVSNAFAHTQQGVVRIGGHGGELVVADSGPGIAPEVAARLYQPGARGAASGGSGLGLSIAARLAARCGIALAIDSSAAGSRATLRFPN